MVVGVGAVGFAVRFFVLVAVVLWVVLVIGCLSRSLCTYQQ